MVLVFCVSLLSAAALAEETGLGAAAAVQSGGTYVAEMNGEPFETLQAALSGFRKNKRLL